MLTAEKDCTKSIAWLSLNSETQEKIVTLCNNFKKRVPGAYEDFYEAVHNALGVKPLTGKAREITARLAFVRNNSNGVKDSGIIDAIDNYLERHMLIRYAAEQVLEQRSNITLQR